MSLRQNKRKPNRITHVKRLASEDVDGGFTGWTIDKTKTKGVRCMELDTIPGHFATTSAMPNIRGKCPHDRQRYYCKDCGGKGICEHGRQRSRCKECGGPAICEHGRRRSECKKCGGALICEHGRVRSKCKECGGASICEHARRRSQCTVCGGAQRV